uniref:NFATC2-interacting protein n=1 Tax=Cynoglossus semilaevis TaxID=244447 RepID=A0A3P8VQ36_CYNSE
MRFSTPLSQVLTRLSSILNVPPSALLLLREELELPQDSSVGELGLGITDILECVVMVTADRTTPEEGVIKFRVQSKDRDASQEFSLHRDAALGSVLTPYLSCFPPCARKKVVFHFDGSKVSLTQTPAELDMEDGDILEVWT